jgi:hypothetical protein
MKRSKRPRGCRIPKVPLRNKYLKYLGIPKEYITSFRFAANVDYEPLYKAFSPRHLASFFCLFGALRIFENYITHKDLKTERGKFITISRDFLREAITNFGSSSSSAINLAVYLGYIERDDSYRVGCFSKGYRLGPKFKNAKWIGMDFLDCLERNIVGQNWRSDSSLPQITLWNKFNIHRARFLDVEDPILKRIIEKQHLLFKDLKVVDDGTFYETAIKAATETFNKAKSEDTFFKVSRLSADYTIDSIVQTYLNSRDIINTGEVYIKCHDKSYLNWTERLFHPVTNMSRHLRKYLRYKGEPLVNVDIRACQVCLLSILYDNNDPLDIEEKSKFVSYVCDKDLYVEISEGLNIDREKSKNTVFKLMFAKNYSQKGVIYERFKLLFPRLTNIIYNIKRKEGYKRVSQIMQRTESKIMIRGALDHIIEKCGIAAFSIHDSILCPKENAQEVKDIISDFFFNEMKFWPILKAE